MGRAPCCDKANVKKGPWSPEEDAKLKQFIEEHGTGGNWISLPQKAGLKRCGKSCRLRWLNYLRPNIKHGHFSEDEDTIICSLYATIGSRWSIIASQLPGRTDNDIKNYWNTKLKKKLLGVPPHSQRKSSLNQTNRHQETLIISNKTPPRYAIAACSNHPQHHSLSSNLGNVTRSCTNDHDQPMFHCTSTTNASLYQNPNFNIDNYQFGAYDQKMVSCSSSDVSNEEIEKFSESYLYGGLDDQNHLLNYNNNWINNPASYIYSSTNGSSGDMYYV